MARALNVDMISSHIYLSKKGGVRASLQIIHAISDIPISYVEVFVFLTCTWLFLLVLHVHVLLKEDSSFHDYFLHTNVAQRQRERGYFL